MATAPPNLRRWQEPLGFVVFILHPLGEFILKERKKLKKKKKRKNERDGREDGGKTFRESKAGWVISQVGTDTEFLERGLGAGVMEIAEDRKTACWCLLGTALSAQPGWAPEFQWNELQQERSSHKRSCRILPWKSCPRQPPQTQAAGGSRIQREAHIGRKKTAEVEQTSRHLFFYPRPLDRGLWLCLQVWTEFYKD